MKNSIVVFILLGFLFSYSPSGLCARAKTKQNVIQIKNTPEGGFTLYVNNRPFLLKGVIYSPRPVGAGYDHDIFTDPAKPWLVDGQLMKEMGINCIRLYTVDSDLAKVKEFISDMYEKFGIYTIASDWLGLWSYPGANYADPEFCAQTKQRLLTIVEALKEEKGLLMWILGNENNYTFSGKIGYWTNPELEAIEEPGKKIAAKAEIYYSFVNDLAGEIKKIDPVHPVALGNGEESYLDIAARTCSNIDALAIIAYRGKTMGSLFKKIRSFFNKPMFMSEFGCDAYDAKKNIEDQEVQSEFLLALWQDLYDNSTWSGQKDGTCLGGMIFEWSDEWWKHNEGYAEDWKVHNTEAGWSNGSYFSDIRAKDNLNMNEEWFGLVGLSEELDRGINKRMLRKAYFDLRNYFAQLPRAPLKKKKVEHDKARGKQRRQRAGNCTRIGFKMPRKKSNFPAYRFR